MKKPCVVLLSGGLDSTTVLAMAKAEGYLPYTMSFAYGQRHAHEITAAKRVAEAMGVGTHKVVEINLAAFGGSALTESTIAVPKDRHAKDMGADIPVTYVPARNTVFLSFALAWAEVLGAFDIFIGANAVDYSGYPDCRPEYLQAFEKMANLATKAAVEGRGKIRIHAPLLELSKAEIIQKGKALGVDYGLTSSCYDPTPEGKACGHCDACQLRLKGFEANGWKDPALYA
ncbi:MAG: exsB protein [Rickettsiales bacterium]|nr:exsB protein [Rickettsiales bacterium]